MCHLSTSAYTDVSQRMMNSEYLRLENCSMNPGDTSTLITHQYVSPNMKRQNFNLLQE